MLVSGSGTLLQALIDEVDDGRLPVDIVAVGADRASAYGLVRARQAGVPTFVHPLPKGGASPTSPVMTSTTPRPSPTAGPCPSSRPTST